MRSVRLPIFDENGLVLPEYLEVDLPYFLPLYESVTAQYARIRHLPPEQEKLPLTEPMWKRIPGYKNYEINDFGDVRNRWTMKLSEVTEGHEAEYVRLHSDDGKPNTMAVEHLRNLIKE